MSADFQAIQLAILASPAAKSKKATEVTALDVSTCLVLTDIFILASGNNECQVRAIVEAVDETMSRHGVRLACREGFQECRWMLLDYGEVAVHAQYGSDRQFYTLERLWADAPVVPIPGPDEPATVVPHVNSGQTPHESATATAKTTQSISPLDFLANKY